MSLKQSFIYLFLNPVNATIYQKTLEIFRALHASLRSKHPIDLVIPKASFTSFTFIALHEIKFEQTMNWTENLSGQSELNLHLKHTGSVFFNLTFGEDINWNSVENVADHKTIQYRES